MKALVTGVSRGIGRGICVRLAKDALARGESARIVATATGKSPDLNNVVEELRAMGAQAHAVTGDLTDAEAPARIVAEATDFCGGLDALVNNAGFPIVGRLRDVKVRHWDLMFAINVRSTLLLGNAAHAALKASGGAICAIGSNAAETVSPNLTGYSASKAALVMLVKTMAYEWGPDGIRVNCVSPGMTHSRSTEKAWAVEGAVDQRASKVPLRRLGTPEDIAAMVSFLVGPDSTYVTGQNVNVDGGVPLVTMEYVVPQDTNYIRDKPRP
ncbi:MAG: SDR family NAD(P)-dependent oxidoreductase [Gammaproteobacteria bacterium]